MVYAVIYSLILVFSVMKVNANTLADKIYTPIDFGKSFCFRLHNFESQVGCQTSRDGDTGVLYPFHNKEMISNTLPALNDAIIPVIKSPLFSNDTAIEFIRHAVIIKGLIIIEEDQSEIESFSPEKTCPGNGFNFGETYSSSDKRECLSQHDWNPLGNWISYFDFPFGIFAIRSESQAQLVSVPANDNLIHQSLKSYPLWGAQIQAFMNAAVDTETCIRRGTCDPIGGLNLHVNFTPLSQEKPIIMIITKADATAFFKDMSYGGEGSGGSLAVLIVLIKALAQVRDLDENNDFGDFSVDLMVTFLQAESFDYSGSQRLAYDLKEESFGSGPRNISLSSIKCIIEIGPVSLSNEIYLHSYNDADETVQQVLSIFSTYSGGEFTFINKKGLPPSSINSFLREDESVPAILITDGGTELVSNFYGSRYDILQNNESLSLRLKGLAEIIANVTLQLGGGVESSNVEVEESLMPDVLDCILVNQNCTILQALLNKTDLENARLSRFSSLGNKTSNCTTYLTLMASEFSKKNLDLPLERCNSSNTGQWTPFIKNGSCYGILVGYTSAKSPAFVTDQLNSTKYATWAESQWSGNFKLRVFLIASVQENILIFCCGIGYLMILSSIIFQCFRKRAEIFSSISFE